MRLITNAGGTHHGAALAEVFEEASTVVLSVAFLKERGAVLVSPLIKDLLIRGGTAQAFVGTDFFLTDPAALAVLLDLSERHPGFDIYIGKRAPGTFHPKVYAGISDVRVRCLIGSANLTGGALSTNEEISLLVETEPESNLHAELQVVWTRLRNSDRFARFDRLALAQYRGRYRPVEKQRRKFDEAVVDADEQLFDLDRLDELTDLYHADKIAMSELQTRRRSRRIARQVQDAICRLDAGPRLGAADRAAFQHHFRDLMTSTGGARHLWASDAIYRQGTQNLRRPRSMINLFKLGQESSALPLEEGYERMRHAAQKLPGAGPNLITEILTTFAPKRYAVFNGNTAGALRHLGLDVPRTSTKNTLSGSRYAAVCSMIQALQARIGAADFPETDAFLNWVYQRIKQETAA